MTPYIPAFAHGLNRGKEMPTVDMLAANDFVLSFSGDDDVAAAAATSPKQQRDLIATLADKHHDRQAGGGRLVTASSHRHCRSA
jgi:hypothetical protein